MSTVLMPPSQQKSRKLTVAAVVILACLLGAFAFLATNWPFSQAAVVKELESEKLGKVSLGAFHGTYFPRPGCVLEQVVFQHNPNPGTPPLITIGRIRIEGSFFGLFSSHVRRVLAEEMHILIPPGGKNEQFEVPQRSRVVIDDLEAAGAILEVAAQEPDKQPLRFAFQEFSMNHIGGSGSATFKARFLSPEPPGEIATTGNFGPWNANDVGKTAVSGQYTFNNADLSVFHGISGMLSSSGKFAGVINHIEVDGETDVPNFAVATSSHQVHLQTRFHAAVNGENGDTFLQNVTASFGQTTLQTEGSVAGRAGQDGKTTSLQITASDGRIQDLLLLFATSKRAPMSGAVGFKAIVSLPPGQRPFLRKVELQGDFGIDAGSFTKPDTQQGINSLSEGARGEDHHQKEKEESDQATVLSDLKGHVLLKDGLARLSNLSFSVPGALAQLAGTYSLISERIDLHGTLRTNAEVSKSTHGVKAMMLKVLDPFFKKKPGVYVAPVKITGTYQHPSFGLDLGDANAKNH